MQANIPAIKKLVKRKFDGNITAFAENINVSRSLASQVVNGKIEPKAKFFCGLIQYCEKNGLDFNKYIFLSKGDKILNSSNRSTESTNQKLA